MPTATPPTRQFLLVNQSTRVTTKEAKAIAAACTLQVKRDYAPIWGMLPVPVRYASAPPTAPTPGTYVMLLLDAPTSKEEEGALGYHTESNDTEWAKVFCNPVLDAPPPRGSPAGTKGGVVLCDPDNDQTPSVASVVSHEVLELLGDLFCNSWVEGPMRKEGNLYAAEVADPVEADQYVVLGGGLRAAVSNFVTPEWFNEQRTPGEKYDYLGLLKKPFTMTPGGYMVVRGVGDDGTEVFARKRPAWRSKMKQAHTTSRMNRRTGAVEASCRKCKRLGGEHICEK